MRLAVIGDIDHGVNELLKYGSSVGYEMVHTTEELPREIASSVHAVIYVIKDTLNDAHDKITSITNKMQQFGIKRLVLHTRQQNSCTVNTPHIDWTVINEAEETNIGTPYDTNFAKFIIGQVTSSQNINSTVVRQETE